MSSESRQQWLWFAKQLSRKLEEFQSCPTSEKKETLINEINAYQFAADHHQIEIPKVFRNGTTP
jgi:hypothetical protein